MNRILVAVDGSAHACKALDIAADLARAHLAQLLIVHVVTTHTPTRSEREIVEAEFSHELVERSNAMLANYSSPDDAMLAGALIDRHMDLSRIINSILGERLLAQSRDQLKAAELESVDALLLEGDAHERIVDLATNRKVDTIVMGCRGQSRLSSLVMGSVSHAVAHAASCTVVMVK